MAKNRSFLNNTSTPVDSVPFDKINGDFVGWLKNQAQSQAQSDSYKSKNIFYGDFIAQVFPDGLSTAGNLFFDPLLASVKLSEENIQSENFEPFLAIVNVPSLTHIETPDLKQPGEAGYDDYVKKIEDIVANLGIFKSYDYLGETPTPGAKVAVSFGDPVTLTDPLFEFPLAGAGFDAVARRLAASGHFGECAMKGATGGGTNGHKFGTRSLLGKLEALDRNIPLPVLKHISQTLNCDISLIRGFIITETGGRKPKANNWNGEANYNKMPHFLFMISNHWTKKYRAVFKKQPNVTWAGKRFTNSTGIWGQGRSLWDKGAYANTSWGIFQIHPWGGVPKALGYKDPKDCAIGMTRSVEAQADALIKFCTVVKKSKSGNQYLLKAMQTFDWCSMGKFYNGQPRSICKYGAKMKAISDLDKQRQTGSQVSVPSTTTATTVVEVDSPDPSAEEVEAAAKKAKAKKAKESYYPSWYKSKTEASKNDENLKKPNEVETTEQTPNVVAKANEKAQAAVDSAKANGKVVYIYGDSNTNANKGAILAWAKKNYPGSKISWQAVDGRKAVGPQSSNLNGPTSKSNKGGTALTSVTSQKAVAVIFGSCGGNDASSAKANSKSLKPGGAWDQELEKLYKKLASLQSGGTNVVVLGPPYGQNPDAGGDNSGLKKRREAMDKAQIRKAAQYKIRYFSVFEQTRKIKLAAIAAGLNPTGGHKVHYRTGKEKKAYRDLVLSLLPGTRPSEEEVKAGKKVKTVEGVGSNNSLQQKC